MQSTEKSSHTHGETETEPKVARFGIMAALLASLCCVGPLIPILLGIGTGSALFGLDRYKPWFVGGGLVLLAVTSWWAIHRQNRFCPTRTPGRSLKTAATIFGVGIFAYLILQYAIVPALAGIASDKLAVRDTEPAAGEATIDSLHTVRIDVEGMTCAACAIGVEEALRDVPGVETAKVNWRTGEAQVGFDPKRVSPKQILKAKVEPQYTLRTEATQTRETTK